MCGLGDEMRIGRTFPIFVYFSAKTDPENEVLGREKTETESKITIPPNATINIQFAKATKQTMSPNFSMYCFSAKTTQHSICLTKWIQQS